LHNEYAIERGEQIAVGDPCKACKGPLGRAMKCNCHQVCRQPIFVLVLKTLPRRSYPRKTTIRGCGERLASGEKDSAAARRILALALVLDGVARHRMLAGDQPALPVARVAVRII
jgi:hypothetical protein